MQEEVDMKKGISLIMVAVLAAGLLTACSSKENQNMNDKNMNDKNMPGMDHSKMQNNDKK